MLNSLSISLVNLAMKLPQLRNFCLKLHQFAVSEEFKGVAQEDYIRILSFFQIDRKQQKKIWFKRFGNPGDGGYVIDSRIDRDSVCLSLGIADDISFESSLSPFVHRIEMYDHSINNIPQSIPNSIFRKERISVEENEINCISLEHAFNRIPLNHPILLKIDIEGDEWSSLAHCNQSSLNRCHQIVVEFHQIQYLPKLIEFNSIFEKIVHNLSHFSVVNVHANNWDSFRVIRGVAVPNVLEVTFVNRSWLQDFNQNKSAIRQIPMNLPNNPRMDEYIIDLNNFMISNNE